MLTHADAAYIARLVRSASSGAALVVLMLTPRPALAAPQSCRAAILQAADQLGEARVAALQRCEDRIVRGKLPIGTDCLSEGRARSAINRATTRVRRLVARKCGGRNQLCNAADIGSARDDTLEAIGWDVGHCPDLETSGCTGPIADCGDVTDCLLCASTAPVDRAVALNYEALTLPTATTDKRLNRCQSAIGREMARFFVAKSRALGQCWTAVNRGKAGYAAPCPLGDPTGRTFARAQHAELRAFLKICAACGGVDKTCGGAGDFNAATIGFPATCPAITVPGGPACGGPVHSLTDLVECATCVANYKVECLTALAVPWGIQYPAECNASCGNGVREASEICDGNDAAACPGACQADCTCASVATPTPHATASPTPAATPGPPVACGAAPRTDCRAPVESGGSVLRLKHATNDRKDHLVWKWTHGALTTRAEFGEPLVAGGTSYALCLYDHAGGAAHLQLAAKAPAGESCDLDHPHPCWRATHDGARYLDKDLTPDGIRMIRLKEGLPGKARISVTGGGPNLALPDLGSLAEPVTVQLVNSLGTCWEGTFIAPALRQDARAFRDTSE